eukprot:1386434-Amphidinium_carterae.1
MAPAARTGSGVRLAPVGASCFLRTREAAQVQLRDSRAGSKKPTPAVVAEGRFNRTQEGRTKEEVHSSGAPESVVKCRLICSGSAKCHRSARIGLQPWTQSPTWSQRCWKTAAFWWTCAVRSARAVWKSKMLQREVRDSMESTTYIES